MSTTVDAEDFASTAPAAPADPFRLDWGRAFRAMKRLIADKEDTAQVFEIMDALSGRATPKGYIRLLDSPQGGRIAFRREEIGARLMDKDWLARLPAGSVGAAYLAFTTGENISAQDLADESRKVHGETIDSEHPYAWFGRRMRDVHDVWHVLTGYGRDALGEACVVAFSHAQTKHTGFGFIALAAGREIKRALPQQKVWKAVWQAWRNGARAAWLPGLDYEALLAEPLESARRRLNIPHPDAYLEIDASVRAQAMTH